MLGRDRTESQDAGPKLRSRFDGARGLAALLLAAVVSALVVSADQLISTWTDEHLFLGWVALWLIALTGMALFAAPASHLSRHALRSLRVRSLRKSEERAQEQLWIAAHRDPRLMADLTSAYQRDLDAERMDRRPWGSGAGRLGEGRVHPLYMNF